MTQAFNLSQFANNLNTSGATSNAGLQNSAVTVTAGTGMSGGGSVALGSSVTLTNAGVTSIVAGTGISVSSATGAVTVTNTASSGVTSLNGATGAITNTNYSSIGSYAICSRLGGGTGTTYNNTYAASSLYVVTGASNAFTQFQILFNNTTSYNNGTLSGTWRTMGSAQNGNPNCCGFYNVASFLAVRVS
jgi:hypothetical protein